VRASGSRECAPDDRLREVIHDASARMDRFVAFAPVRKRVAFVAGIDVVPANAGTYTPRGSF